MNSRIYIFRTPSPGGGPPRGNPFGCLLYLVGLVSLGILGLFILAPLLAMAAAIGLAAVAFGMLVIAYLRLRAWWRRKFGRAGGDKYEATVLDSSDDDEDGQDGSAAGSDSDRPRLTVEVRRRPHRE